MTETVFNPALQPRAFLEFLLAVTVRRALPLENTAAYLPQPPKGRTIVIGAGKADGSMAPALPAPSTSRCHRPGRRTVWSCSAQTPAMRMKMAVPI